MRRKKLSGAESVLVCLLGLAIAGALAVLIRTAAVHADGEAARGGFTPPPFDPAAEAGVPEPDEALGWAELAVREGYVVRLCGVLTADAEGNVPVWLYSDGGNDVWLKLRARDGDGSILGETGLLKPGEYVEYLRLDDVSAVTDGMDVTLQLMGYEPETYYSAGSVGLATTLHLTDLNGETT